MHWVTKTYYLYNVVLYIYINILNKHILFNNLVLVLIKHKNNIVIHNGNLLFHSLQWYEYLPLSGTSFLSLFQKLT